MRHETGFQIEALPLVRLGGLAAGTRVRTPSGEVPVEALRRLDRVLTPRGPAQALGLEERRGRVAPLRITAEALGRGMPGRDLIVGPATRLWLPRQSRPIEAFRIVDGTYVVEERPRWMALWTVTLVRGGSVLAEGVEVAV